MAIIIGAATTVNFGGACVVSANWGFNPNTQRAYCIGSWVPDDQYTIYRPTETLSLTVYAPSGQNYSTTPTQGCEDANTLTASVSPAACGTGDFDDLTGNWFVTSYSYSKEDSVGAGQESWSMQRWTDGGPLSAVTPDYILRGITEGQATDPNITGITFASGQTLAESQTGSVSAGGIGKADIIEQGVVDEVGSGSGAQGETGNGSASMPYTPLYIGTT